MIDTVCARGLCMLAGVVTSACVAPPLAGTPVPDRVFLRPSDRALPRNGIVFIDANGSVELEEITIRINNVFAPVETFLCTTQPCVEVDDDACITQACLVGGRAGELPGNARVPVELEPGDLTFVETGDALDLSAPVVGAPQLERVSASREGDGNILSFGRPDIRDDGEVAAYAISVEGELVARANPSNGTQVLDRFDDVACFSVLAIDRAGNVGESAPECLDASDRGVGCQASGAGAPLAIITLFLARSTRVSRRRLGCSQGSS